MATKLKIVDDASDLPPLATRPRYDPGLPPRDELPPLPPREGPLLRPGPPAQAETAPPSPDIDFDLAPTRKRHAGWSADRQRDFIRHLALTGNVGEACALVGVASSSAYRLRNKAGAESFARAWDAALRLCATRLTAIMLDRAVNGRVERHYRNGELVMERRVPSDYLLTWLVARLDPLTFGSPTARALAAATGDPRDAARTTLPDLMADFRDVAEDDCPTEDIDFLDHRLGEAGSGDPIADGDRG